VQRMAAEDMHYPLHLGVTEAGDGEDGRIKSAIGIGSLLLDGLGDTIRVSLTEDSVYEIPVAQALARKAMARWRPAAETVVAGAAPAATPLHAESVDPYHYARREVVSLALGDTCAIGPEQPPRVIVRAPSVAALPEMGRTLATPRLADTPPEGLLVPIGSPADLASLTAAAGALPVAFLALEFDSTVTTDDVEPLLLAARQPVLVVRPFQPGEDNALRIWAQVVHRGGRHVLAVCASPDGLASLAPCLSEIDDERMLITLPNQTHAHRHPIGAYRQLAAVLSAAGSRAPLWIRNTPATALAGDRSFLSRLLDASILTGALLCDGLGDLVSIESEPDTVRAVQLTYNVLQGAGARISKTEFVACPSCGRTLFDLQTTTQRIRAQTGHLKGVKIAIMGCIVNGPGEMADADFGYVGGAPGKINLYVGKTCVQYNIPQAEADERLIALIRAHGKWFDPPPTPAA
jgi:(E)-4-hydroxy-3-methylbut-2-enyl-diphosphate synthase